MPDRRPAVRPALRPAAVAPFLAILAGLVLAPAALADVAGGADTAGGSILFWLTVLACVGVVVGTVVFYAYRRRHPR